MSYVAVGFNWANCSVSCEIFWKVTR